MKKKIIFVTQALWYGGIENALINLLNQIDYEKYDVTLLTLRAIFDFDLKERVNVKCRLLAIDREREHSFNKRYKYVKLYRKTEECTNPSLLHRVMMWSVPIIKWVENYLYIKYVRELMKNEHFDTAIIYSDVVAETVIKAINANKYLMFYHHGAMRHVYHDKIAYKKCDKIIAVSQNQAKELKKFVPQCAEKIIVIHNLIDCDEIRYKSHLSCEDIFDTSKFNIVSVGRVSHEKGMDLAVEVCAKLVKDGYEDMCLWIVGDGSAINDVKKKIKELDVERYVKLVGRKCNPYPYIRQADLYVQPSRFEGYPMTILEALVLGQVVVSTNNNGAREIIKSENIGVLCPIDSQEIAKAIESLIGDKENIKWMKEHILNIDFYETNKKEIQKLEKIL